MINDNERINIVPYIDEREEVGKKVGRYIHHVMYYANLLEQVGIRHPTVFMSHDVMEIISRRFEDSLKYVRPLPTQEAVLTFCGYRVKTVSGENVLSIGVNVI